MISLTEVSKIYGKTKAVNQISFSVKQGEKMILLGTSGCGKTTTLRMINRLADPSAGIIEIDGRNIANEQPEKLRRGIGYVLQDNGLFPHYTIAENVAVVPRLLKWDTARIKNRSAELLEKLHLAPSQYLNAYPHQLSGGQQQRVGLARALMADPPVLLMDEPLGALDPVTRASIRKEFKELDELKGKTVVMVTHDVLEAFELADRICVMDKGEIVQTGTPVELLFKPQSGFITDFFNGQRLLLELQTLSLADVWPYLPIEDRLPQSASLQSETTVWEAFEKLLKLQSNQVGIKNQHTGEYKTAGYKDLMNAYSQFKSAG